MKYVVTITILTLVVVLGWRLAHRFERKLVKGFVWRHGLATVIVIVGVFCLAVFLSMFEVKLF